MNTDEIMIREILYKIFNERFKIDISNKWNDVQDLHFLSNKFGMAPRDLLYLHSDIEREFNIRISEEHIVNDKFTTLNNIIQIISYELKVKASVDKESMVS